MPKRTREEILKDLEKRFEKKQKKEETERKIKELREKMKRGKK